MNCIPESFLLKLKNEDKLYNFESYKQLKIKIETLKFERKIIKMVKKNQENKYNWW